MKLLPKHTARNISCGMFFLTLAVILSLSASYNLSGGIILGTSLIGYAGATLECDYEGL